MGKQTVHHIPPQRLDPRPQQSLSTPELRTLSKRAPDIVGSAYEGHLGHVKAGTLTKAHASAKVAAVIGAPITEHTHLGVARSAEWATQRAQSFNISRGTREALTLRPMCKPEWRLP